jgi:DNA primase
MMRDRIYIPIFRDGVLVGWQGRWPADLNWRAVDFPKYYTSPGLKKSQLLYNQDLARQQPLVVVCEGVSDVWRVGPAGVALLGKTASREQIRLLATGWGGKPAIVLLDADAEQDARILTDQLRPFFGRRLVRAVLPQGLDPGQCPRADLWHFLQAMARGQDVELTMPEPAFHQITPPALEIAPDGPAAPGG